MTDSLSNHSDTAEEPRPVQAEQFVDAASTLSSEADAEAQREYGDELGRTLSRHTSTVEDDVLSRVLTSRRTFSNPIPNMGGDKPMPPPVNPDRKQYMVEFDGPDDPICPLNWPTRKKVILGGALSFVTATIAWGSAIFAAAEQVLMAKFHIGTSVVALGVSLYVMGFATGPCLWGPLSEFLGRKIPLVLSVFLFTCFTFATATAENVQTVMICRFFAGACGSAPLSIVPAVFADLFETKGRGLAASLFSLAVTGGPMVAPIVGGFITASYLGWRWTMYITGIMGALCLVICTVLFEETYHPVILVSKAEELRERSGNWAIYAQHETVTLDIKGIVTKTILRPIMMLFQEPILFLLSLYAGFVYGLLYMNLSAVPIIFSGYGWKGGVVMLPYIALFLGCVVACILVGFVFEPIYLKKVMASKYPVLPEERLPPMMLGSVVFCVGIFWMCWTGAYPEHVHWLAPAFGGGFFGLGFLLLFLPIINYILDSYLMLAASAMAANTFLRSAMGAAFPLFSVQMFRNLGIQWAGTLIGCLAAVMVPVPFLFYVFGARIRQRSKYAINLDDVIAAQLKAQQAKEKVE